MLRGSIPTARMWREADISELSELSDQSDLSEGAVGQPAAGEADVPGEHPYGPGVGEAEPSELSELSDLSEGELLARRQPEERTRCIASLPDGAIPDASISRISLTVLMPRWSLPEAMGSGSPG